MSRHQGRGGLGSRKHGTSGRAGPPSAVKRSTAKFFNQEDARRQRRRSRTYGSVRAAFEREKPR